MTPPPYFYVGPENLLLEFLQIAKKVFADSRVTCLDFVQRILAREKSTVLTVNNIYTTNITNLQRHLATLRSSRNFNSSLEFAGVKGCCHINFYELQSKTTSEYHSAFDLKLNLVVYMSIVYARIADEISVELHYSLEGALLKGLDKGVREAAKGQDMAHLMQEHPLNLQHRTNLRKRVEVLEDCKEVLRNVL